MLECFADSLLAEISGDNERAIDAVCGAGWTRDLARRLSA